MRERPFEQRPDPDHRMTIGRCWASPALPADRVRCVRRAESMIACCSARVVACSISSVCWATFSRVGRLSMTDCTNCASLVTSRSTARPESSGLNRDSVSTYTRVLDVYRSGRTGWLSNPGSRPATRRRRRPSGSAKRHGAGPGLLQSSLACSWQSEATFGDDQHVTRAHGHIHGNVPVVQEVSQPDGRAHLLAALLAHKHGPVAGRKLGKAAHGNHHVQ